MELQDCTQLFKRVFFIIFVDSNKAAAPVAAAAAPASVAAPAAAAGVAAAAAVATPVVQTGDRLKASPYAKKLASEKNVPLNQLAGSGPGGRIVANDVNSYVPSAAPAAAPVQAAAAAPVAAPAGILKIPRNFKMVHEKSF